ncbi:MAG: SWIB/MDM2 domain-containing protein [Nevskia sp.]|nr:SWIB/MDM2 domain-containing protein [Nevskia sp.]
MAKAAKKAAVKKTVSKPKAAPKKTKRKANPALLKPVTPSAVLAEVIGPKPAPRGQIVKRIWEYIRKQGLQDAVDRRMINADEKLKKLFGGKSAVSMFELTRHISKHVE